MTFPSLPSCYAIPLATISAALLTIACTRPNPAFDGGEPVADESEGETRGEASDDDPSTGESESGTTVDESEAESEAESDSEGETESDTESMPDLPPECPYAPSKGLSLILGEPGSFESNTCPDSFEMQAKVISAQPTELTVQQCAPQFGCGFCDGPIRSLSVSPLPTAESIPGECLMIEVVKPLPNPDEICVWSAMTIAPAQEPSEPYVIATSQGGMPTPLGAGALGESIPAPEKDGSCSCEAVAGNDDCCVMGREEPWFYFYPWPGDPDGKLFPGEHTSIPLPNVGPTFYTFEVFQAQQLFTCDKQGPGYSWAVYRQP